MDGTPRFDTGIPVPPTDTAPDITAEAATVAGVDFKAMLKHFQSLREATVRAHQKPNMDYVPSALDTLIDEYQKLAKEAAPHADPKDKIVHNTPENRQFVERSVELDRAISAKFRELINE